MNLKSIKENALNEINRQQKLAANGEDFSPAVIEESKRMIALVDDIVPQITESEWELINSGIPGLDPSDDWKASVKSIKDRLGLSWKEIEALRNINGGI